jgi:CHAD domain-containing protein
MAKRKLVSGLDCSAPADQMIRLVLRAQLRAMCKLRDKALDWSDPEGVHDMRVWSRRLRSAISDFKPSLRRTAIDRLRLRTIADALGAVRDEDVAIIALDELATKAKAEAAEGIKAIADEHKQKRKDARTKLKVAIKPGAIRDLKKEFETELNQLALRPAKKSKDKSVQNVIAFGVLGREVILARIKELRRAIHHLYFPSHNRELHELRILAKRLRYALELFSNCWEPHLSHTAKEISLLQTSLGELHDCDLWLDSLGNRLKQIARHKNNDANALKIRAGAVWLVNHFATHRTEHYQNALTRWEEWEANNFLDEVELILKA